MPSKKACLGGLCISFAIMSGLATYGAWKLYPLQKIDGELILENAPSEVSILRESDTGILHIKGEDMNAVAYGAGFAHA